MKMNMAQTIQTTRTVVGEEEEEGDLDSAEEIHLAGGEVGEEVEVEGEEGDFPAISKPCQ